MVSAPYIPNPDEDAAFSLRDIGRSLNRLADTLDDYMEMTLNMAAYARTAPADPEAALEAIAQVLDDIRKRRADR